MEGSSRIWDMNLFSTTYFGEIIIFESTFMNSEQFLILHTNLLRRKFLIQISIDTILFCITGSHFNDYNC